MNDELRMKNEERKMKNEELLELYLAGKAPLHADRLNVPSDEELEAAEAEFDRMVAGRQQPARRITFWPWAVGIAAAVVLAFILWPKVDSEEDVLPLAINETQKMQEHEQEEQPLIAQQAEPERPVTVKKARRSHAHKKVEEPLTDNKGVDKPLAEKIASLTIVPTSADLGPGVTMRLGGPADTLAHKGVDEQLEQKIASLTVVPRPADITSGVTMRAGKPCPITAGVEPLQEEEVSPIPTDKQALADIYLAEEALQVAYELRAQQEAIRAYAASLAGEEVPKPVVAY